MISTNRVRNVILYFLNKENRGFIEPKDYDSFSDMAQLAIFEDLFYDYAKWVANKTNRRANSGFSDIPANIKEQISTFLTYSTTGNFTYNATDNIWEFSGNDLYRNYSLSAVNAQGKKVYCEIIDGTQINLILNSEISAPTLIHPVYEKVSSGYKIYPTLPAGMYAELQYIRRPKTPKWTYNTISGNPFYNASAGDLQDFELPESLYEKLVVKILSYCGISIREEQVVQAANIEEQKIQQTTS